MRVRVSQLELTRLQLDPAQTPDYAAKVGTRLMEDLQLWTDSGRCAAGAPSLTGAGDGWLNLHWRLSCMGNTGLTIRSRLLHDVAPSHLHFVSVRLPDGEQRERVLTYAEPALVLDIGTPPATRSLGHYLRLGIEHILSGWDHLAFVLALVLLAGSLREIAIIATGFTIAHSLTLALAVLGMVQTRSEVVEALIGFSIALVAAENLWQRAGQERWLPWLLVLSLAALALTRATQLPLMVLLGLALFCACHFSLLTESTRPARLRAALAVIFGLVHGFGFAGVMAELQLPRDQLALALFGFNSGVEIGQLLVIGLAWPALRFVARWPGPRLWVNDIGAAFICALGTYWFVVRSFG
ncbi:MAG: HupE/UreJ family protein [Nevskiales bacterium]